MYRKVIITFLSILFFELTFANKISNFAEDCVPYYYEFSATGCYLYEWNHLTYTQSGNYTQTFIAKNGCDSIVTLHLTMNMPMEYEYDVTSCGSYTRNGRTYTESGIYYQPFYSPDKCDSIVVINLTIRPVYNIQIHDVVCKDHVYQGHGFYVNSYGLENPIIRTKHLTTYYGCDSTVNLILNILEPEYFLRNITACGSYIWEGQTYTQSGSYTRVFVNSNNCDSIVTMNLTILPLSYSEFYAESCEEYFWNNKTYTTSGNYQQFLSNSTGCDSIITMHLTIHNASHLNYYDQICQGQIYAANGYYVNTAGMSGLYTETINLGSTIYGCDSTKTLFLTVLVPTYDTIPVSSCGPYTWHSTVYPASGLFTKTFLSQQNCDSIVTINLTINQNYNNDVYVESCGPTYYSGIFYFQNGTYTYHYISSKGCDSTVRVHVTIYPAQQYYSYDTISCGPLFWGGAVYSVPGSYTHTFINNHGCDSIVTINLLGFGNFAYGQITDTACGSYTLNNITYSSTGTYTQNISRPNKCDSILTLNLTIIEEPHSYIFAEECNSFLFNNQIYTETGTYYQVHQIPGACDSVVEINVIIHPNYNIVIHDSICRGDIYNQYNFYLETQNLFGTVIRNQQKTSVFGCDSLIILYLTILPKYNVDIYDQICKGGIYNNHGFYINTNNVQGLITQTLYLHTTNECDSTINLFLTVFPSENIVIDVSACDSYYWNGQIYTQSGTYTQYFTNKSGCDSVVTKNIIISNSVTKEIIVETCGYYSWYGQMFSVSGIYTHLLTGPNGCDSLLYLHLTIYPSYNIPETVHSCGPYIWDGTVYSTSGQYTKTYLTVHGCDSIVTKYIYIHTTQNIFISEISCGPYNWNGKIYENSGIFPQSFTDIYGCDSIVTLNLTIKATPYSGVIVGPTNVIVATDTWGGIYDYHVEDADGFHEYIWKISNPQWVVLPNGKNCKLYVTTPGIATLSVQVKDDFCLGEISSLLINAVFGIDDNNNDMSIIIFPNPTKDFINIKVTGLFGLTKVSITDVTGNVLDFFSVQVHDETMLIPYSFASFNNGVYFVEINNNKKSFVNKVIIRK